MVEVGASVGGHRLVRLLGHGGFGSVYLGESPAGELGAVKVMHPQHADDQGIRERFAREVELARKVASFCTARVVTADPHADAPWVVTEYVEGETLHHTVRTGGPRVGAELERLAVSTATALAAIHAAEIVHRDFTPANIMLAPDGPRVIDFGVARALEGSTTLSSSLIGTPQYMAPEQISGEPATSAIDLFAWGSVITFAATGKAPFDGPHPAAILHRLVSEEPDLNGVPEALRPVVVRCLDKDPAKRPTAAELLSLLIAVSTLPAPEESGQEEPAPEEPVPEAVQAPAPDRQAPAPSARTDSPHPRPDPPEWPLPYRGDLSEPFAFAGREYQYPGDLAEAMSHRWDDAVGMLESRSGREALATWLPPGSPARRGVENEQRLSPDVEVASLVAVVRPDLPPTYRGTDLTLAGIARLASASHQEPRLNAALQQGLLWSLAPHHCAEPDHACAPDRPCDVYRELARQFPAAADLADRYRRWSAHLNGRFTDPRMRVDTDPATLVSRLAEELTSDRADGEAVDAAAEQVPPGPWRDALRNSGLAAPAERRRAAAAAIRTVTGTVRGADHAQKRLGGLSRMEESRAALEREANFSSVVAFLGAGVVTLVCGGIVIPLFGDFAIFLVEGAVLLTAIGFAWAGFYTFQKRRELPRIPPSGEIEAVRRLITDGDRYQAEGTLKRALTALPQATGPGSRPSRTP
ncbi:serine/threonine-protein kinase [Nocardiopsis oceani]